MIRDLRPALRRILLASGLPLVPFSCMDAGQTEALPHEAGHEDAAAPERDAPERDAPERDAPERDAPGSEALLDARGCLGVWGDDRTIGGCTSGSYMQVREEFRLLDPAKPQHASLHARCSTALGCPSEICHSAIDFVPRMTAYDGVQFGSIVQCAPACKDGIQAGVHVVYTVNGWCTGRRPEGLPAAAPITSSTELGAFFAEVARLEAASVPAFARLARELLAHDAPEPLVAAATRAVRDEMHHFEITRALAARFGAAAEAPYVPAHGVRSLEDVALENATEGCVGEAFGALFGAWQAVAARDLGVQAAMVSIADDEAAHAALAVQVDAWARTRLDARACRRLDHAREQAFETLAARVEAVPVSAPLSVAAGVPSAAVQRSLLAGLRSALTASA